MESPLVDITTDFFLWEILPRCQEYFLSLRCVSKKFSGFLPKRSHKQTQQFVTTCARTGNSTLLQEFSPLFDLTLNFNRSLKNLILTEAAVAGQV